MIFYDFSLHLIELFFGTEKARNLKYYWPAFHNRKIYTTFWTVYWGIAFILLLIYLLFR